MIAKIQWVKSARFAVGAGLALLLTGCFLSPGKFESAMDVRKDGTFTFSYEGEIYLLALSQLADMADSKSPEEFTAQACWDEDYNDRECSEEEIAQQRSEWESSQQSSTTEDERNSEALKTLMGGIDPSDPKAAEEIARRLRRQEGWKRVDYMGGGLFSVDFTLTSRLGHDFTFPIFEGFPLSNGFVIANLRQGNVVRIEAPGYSAQSASGNPMTGLMQAAALSSTDDEAEAESVPGMPELDGTFTITTDARILANNTDEGPAIVGSGQQLVWHVDPRSPAAPTALLQMGN